MRTGTTVAERPGPGGPASRGARHRRGLRAPRGAVAMLGALAVLLAGCASMPDEGEVRRVDPSLRTDTGSQVRVFGVSPRKGAQPWQIVRGFLEATTSDEPRFSTAREYLTEDTARSWDPFARTTVVDGAPSVFTPGEALTERQGRGATLEVTGDTVAVVDGEHAYRPGEGTYREMFHLVQVEGEWRIDRLPDGLVVAESDFQRIYRSVDTYHYADLGPDTGAVARGTDVLVADPVYLRQRIDPVTEAVRAVLDGPTGWLAPVVGSAFPAGTRLADGARVSPDDSGTLVVPLAGRGLGGGGGRPQRLENARCDRMAAQLLYTVDGQVSARVERVRLTRGQNGAELCTLNREEAAAYAPGRLNGGRGGQYFVDDRSRLSEVGEGPGRAEPVSGPFGTGQVQMSAVSVSRDERRGAGVSLDGRSLYVAPLSADVELGAPVLTSEAARERDGLTNPTWDGLGDLWLADRNPDDPGLLRLRGGQEEPETVEVTGLGEGRIEALRVSSDGVRMALLVSEGDRTGLLLGRIVRQGAGDGSRAVVEGLRPIAPRMDDVVDASWAGDSRLVVVGREAGGVQQLRYIATDGSPASPSTLPGLNEVTGVAASEDEEDPLLADTKEGIARLAREDWELVTDEGSKPVYPG